MKIKKKKQEQRENLNERIENFLHSDSIPANATKFLLMFMAVGVVACGGAVVPGVLKALKDFDLGEDKTGYDKKRISDALGNLKRQKLVEIIKDDDNKVSVRLTNKGKSRIREFSIDTVFIKKPEKWDGKWRILIFDIPTKPKIYNLAREALRNKIKDLGFYQMQKSVWVYPYDFEDEILFVAEAFEVQKHVEILTVEKLLHGKKIKRFFGL
jgi:DNA-binding transcriptional regulator PaaX